MRHFARTLGILLLFAYCMTAFFAIVNNACSQIIIARFQLASFAVFAIIVLLLADELTNIRK